MPLLGSGTIACPPCYLRHPPGVEEVPLFFFAALIFSIPFPYLKIGLSYPFLFLLSVTVFNIRCFFAFTCNPDFPFPAIRIFSALFSFSPL